MKTENINVLKSEIDPDEEIVDLRQRVKTLNSRIKTLKSKYGKLKTFFADVTEHLDMIDQKEQVYKPAKQPKKVTNPIIAVCQSSDSHMGAVQDPDEIEGFNEFSPEICRKRSLFFTEQMIEWVELHRSNYTCDELHHIVTGDMISGDIHKELSITNAFPTPIQVIEAAILLSDQVSLEAPYFKSVTVEFICEDNHSRLTKIPQASQAGQNTLNYLVGYIAKERLKNHKNVTFNLYPQLQKVINVGNRRYLITHGHKVRGWAGFPWYGLERKVGRESIKRMMTNSGKFDRIIAGHYHTPLVHPWFWLSGSIQGTSAYDHGEGRHATPTQPAWFVHPKHGEFDRTDFDLSSVT